MPEKVEAWMRDELTARVWDILDAIKAIDETMIKDWIKENWPDALDIYG